MATKLLNKLKQEEALESKEASQKTPINDNGARRHKALNKISTRDSSKDKQISAKVNGSVYATFTEINKAQGISNNSALNMILTKYVRENKNILDDI